MLPKYRNGCVLFVGLSFISLLRFSALAYMEIYTLKPVKYGNTCRLELNDELFEGVRYGWINVRSVENQRHISNVRLVCHKQRKNNYMTTFPFLGPGMSFSPRSSSGS